MAEAKGSYVGGTPVYFKDEKARAMLSNEYVPAENYAAGNLCIHEGKLYKATKATTGTWDATAWTETNLAEVNAGMQKSITDLTEKTEWKLFGSRTGSNIINIKELIDAGREIKVVVEAQYSSSGGRTKFIFDLPSEDIVGTYSAGYCFSSSNYASVAIFVTAEYAVAITPSWWKVVENASSTITLSDTTATLKVYYR